MIEVIIMRTANDSNVSQVIHDTMQHQFVIIWVEGTQIFLFTARPYNSNISALLQGEQSSRI